MPSPGSLELRQAPSLLKALDRVLSPSGFPYGSNCYLFREAQFGRDALEVAEDLLSLRPAIAGAVIRRLAALQGVALDPATEEEPGKIHHEHRALVMDGKPVSDESAAMFRALAQHWGLAANDEDHTSLTTYMTVDATPLYVRLIHEYCKAYGSEILGEEYPQRHPASSGGAPKSTIRDSVRRAVDWIVRRMESSDLGLLEFQRMSPWGHRFQAWKDGATSYLHPDGRYANFNAPMASIEVQGLAYDALTAAPLLLHEASSQEQERWMTLAERLQQTVVQRFWMPDERYFAMALDRDPQTGEPRQLKLIASNPGALLDSRLFDTVEPADLRPQGGEARRLYVTAIVERLYSDEFLTPAGIRCSSLVHRDVLDYPAYQSSHTVWHKETYDIAKGFYRQGFPRIAEQLENRLLNAVNLTGGATEFLYVLPDNRVDYDPLNTARGNEGEEIAGTNVPEDDQAWSISAALAVKWRRGRRESAPAPQAAWQRELEDRLLGRVAPVKALRSLQEVRDAFPTTYSFSINRKQGWKRERAYIQRHTR